MRLVWLPPEALTHQMMHFQEQRRRNLVFFSAPVTAIRVKVLAELIEPRLAVVARQARARPILALPLIALQIAEAQSALINNWLAARPMPKPDIAAEALVAVTRATLTALLRCPPGASLLIPGEKLRFVHVGEDK